MRKSDKLKNFKKINLIVENRYLESKGIVPESSYNADGDEIYTNNPEAMRNYLNKFNVVGDFKFKGSDGRPYNNDAELDEGFFSGLKDKANRIFDISSKENEANKQKAIDEIMRFNFESLFYQPGEGQVLRKDVAEQKVADAARAMPTVKQLNPLLFELNGGYFSNATMKINDKLYRGVIPSCFEFIRDVNDEISNYKAKRSVISNLG
jgi:hypothetical protein